MTLAARILVFNASIVLLVGLLYGAPYGRAVVRKLPDHIVNSWRVAHLSIPLGATLMFAVAAILSSLSGGVVLQWLIALSLIVSAYAFSVSTGMAAVTGHRGLDSRPKGAARIVYIGNVLGAATSLLGSVFLVIAAGISL